MNAKKVTFCVLGCLVACFPPIGCSSYSPSDRSSSTSENAFSGHKISFKSESYEIQLITFNDTDLANRYIGIDPIKTSMVPVVLGFTNLDKHPVKVNVLASSIQTEAGQLFSAIPIDEAIARASRSDSRVVDWALVGALAGFPLVGEPTIASKNRTLEEHYHQRSFKPSLISSTSRGEGLIFFNVPPSEQQRLNAIIIHLSDPLSHESRTVAVNL